MDGRGLPLTRIFKATGKNKKRDDRVDISEYLIILDR
jgi:hypothetical protein